MSPCAPDRVPLTSFQEELWLADESLPLHHPGIFTGAVFELNATLNPHLLRQALLLLVEHAPLLGATLCPTEQGFPEWALGVWPEPELWTEDFRNVTDPESAARTWRQTFQERPIQPLGGRLASFALLTLTDTRQQLVVRVFHLAADGLALDGHILQLQQLYTCLLLGQTPPETKALQWVEDTEQDRTYLESARAQHDVEFWERYLTALPDDRLFALSPSAHTADHAAAGRVREVVLALSPESAERFFALAERSGSGPSVLLVALHAFWLARLLDRDSVLLHQPFSRVAQKARKNFWHRHGYRAATVPLHIPIDFTRPFSALLATVKVRSSAVLRRLHVPVQRVARQRSLPPMPVETFANYIPQPEQMQSGNFRIRVRHPISSAHDPVPLGIHALPGEHTSAPRSLSLTFMYHEDYFSLDDMHTYVIRLEQALLSATQSPNTPVADMPFLTPHELTCLHGMEQGDVCPIPSCGDIPSLFDAQALATPQRAAVCGMDGATYTYADIQTRANALATLLSSMDSKPGQVVAVLALRHARLPEIVLGIMKAGAVYLPVDPDYPQDRIQHMLEDSGARLLLALPGESIPAACCTVANGLNIPLVPLPETFADAAAVPPAPRTPNPEAPAYLIYTSGSTGLPKGVLLRHRGFVNMILAQIEALGVRHAALQSEGVLQFASPSFDASLSEIFMALLCGATLYPVSRSALDDPQQLAAYMATHKITVLTLPPSYLALYRGRPLPGVRVLLTAGEAPVLEDVRRHSAHVRYFNAYGPTESSVCASLIELFPDCTEQSLTIGRPLPNTSAFILDRRGHRLPPGVPGELCLGGEGLALGYHNHPELTAERFFLAPFAHTTCTQSPCAGLRLYRTGDRALWSQNGQLRLLGRMDDQVKIRGHRVELGEIQAHLEAHPGIRRAAVFTMPAANGVELAAAAEGNTGTVPSSVLRQWLMARLPAHMLPHRIRVLERMPVSPTGKVDKAALVRLFTLPTADSNAVPHHTEQSEPVNSPSCERVQECCEAILGHAVSDPHASWHSQGGDSLSAIRLVRRLSDTFGVPVPARAFFADSSLAGVCRLMDTLVTPCTVQNTSPTIPSGMPSPIPLTAGQLQLWAEHCLGSSARYNMPFALSLRGDSTSVEALLTALSEAVAEQPLCRSVVGGEMDAPCFVPEGRPSFVVERLNLRFSPQPEADAAHLCDARIHAPFDLAAAPGIRATALQLGNEHWRLLLITHHILADADSLCVLVCRALRRVNDPQAPPLDAYAALRSHSTDEEPDTDATIFWRQTLVPLPDPLRLGTAPATHTTPRGTGQTLRCAFDAAPLRQMATEQGASLLEAFLGHLLAFLQRHTHRQDVCVAVPVSTRESNQADAVGYFVNLLVLRLRETPQQGDAQSPYAAYVQQAASLLRKALPHSTLPFARMASVLDVPTKSLEGLTSVMTTHIDLAHMAQTLRKAAEGLDLTVALADTPLRTAKFPFSFLLITEENSTLSLALEYDTALCCEQDAAALLHTWAAFLEHREDKNTPIALPPHVPAKQPVPKSVQPPAPDHSSTAIVRQVWHDILGVLPDDGAQFFEQGGDSIKAIQIVGQLRRCGVTALRPADFFEAPTFASLCARIQQRAADAQDSASQQPYQPDAGHDEIPLLPLQAHTLCKHPEHWRHFHMALPLRLAPGTNEYTLARLKDAIQALPSRHEALRLVFSQSPSGGLVQTHSPSPKIEWGELFLPEADDRHALSLAAERLFARLDGLGGPLWGAVLVRRSGRAPLLLVGLHHFICDALSLDIVRQELTWFCEHGHWPPSSSWGVARWARHAHTRQSALPPTEDTRSTEVHFAALRSAPDTVSLRVRRQTTVPLPKLPAMREALLASLCRALYHAGQTTPLTLLLEEHGRNTSALENSTHVDITQSVGWFTCVRPVTLPPGPAVSTESFTPQLTGVASFFAPNAAQCSLNYLGRLAVSGSSTKESATQDNVLLTLVPDLALPGVLPGVLPAAMEPDTPLEFTAWFDAKDELCLMAWFSPQRFDPLWVENLLAVWGTQLGLLSAEIVTSGSKNHEEARNERHELARQCGCTPQEIVAVRAADPNQEGMLYHGLLDAAANYPAYVQHLCLYVYEDGCAVDTPLLAEAWQTVLRRHTNLHTRFVQNAHGDMCCVELCPSALSFTHEDWRELPETAVTTRLQEAAEAAQHHHFDTARGPLFLSHLAAVKNARYGACAILGWTFHHILMDGWCTGILLEELRVAYRALQNGQPCLLPPPADVQAYRGWLADRSANHADAARQFWQNLVCDAVYTPAVSPRDTIRAKQSAQAGPQSSELRLSADQTTALHRLARTVQVTLPHLLQALWAILLQAISTPEIARNEPEQKASPQSTGDVLFGLVVAGRPSDVPNIERMVGLFTRTVPTRASWNASTTLAQLAVTLRRQAVSREPHEHLPLPEIQRLASGRTAEALFDHVLVFENTPLPGPSDALRFALISGFERPPYALTVCVVPEPEKDGLLFRFVAQAAVMPQTARLMTLWQTLLDALVTAGTADIPCAALLQTTTLARPVPSAWHHAECPHRETESSTGLVSQFLRIARKYHDKTACIDSATSSEAHRHWSYAQIEAEARRIAAGLRLVPGEPVAMLLPRGGKAVASMLGILMAGGCFVPLDEHNPPARHAAMLRIAGCRLCLTDGDVPAGILPDTVEQRPLQTARDTQTAAGSRVNSDCADIFPDSPDALAYIMFTSGSTGEPKGVLIPQRAVLRLVCNSNFWHLPPGGRVLHGSSLAFDASTLEIWGSLLCGGVLICVDTTTLLTPEALSAFMDVRQVEYLWLTSSLCNMLVDADPHMFAKARQLLVGGEVLSAEHMGRLMAACPDLEIYNGYGPTENTTFTTTHRLTPQDVASGRIPIGRPVSNTRVYILNSENVPCGIGETGELCTAGDGLALGYVGQPNATAAVFTDVHIPFADGVHSERVYRTGDLARWIEPNTTNTDAASPENPGVLEYMGRRDQQVKIRGYRIELEEVEQALCAIPGIVRAGCAAPRREKSADNIGATRSLTAAVCTAPGSQLTHAAILRALGQRLPSYMLPERIVMVDTLPMTVNGKLDRAALEVLTLSEPELPPKPATELCSTAFQDNEAQVAALFETLLGVPVTTPTDDFLLLGGQSLKAMRLLGRVNSQLMPDGARLTIRDIMTHTQVRDLARRIRDVAAANQGVEPAKSSHVSQAAEPAAKQTDFPLSAGQERLWTLQHMHPESVVYTLPFAVRLPGDIDTNALNHALALLETRHQALRLRLPASLAEHPHADGALLLQREAPAGTWRLDQRATTDIALAHDVLREADRPFTLGYEHPLVRAVLYRTDTQAVLLLNAHHAIMDGWSFEILLRELAEAYAHPQPLWADAAPYTDAIAQQRLLATTAHGLACLDYWKNRLTPLPEPLQLPLDKPRPAVQHFGGAVCRAALPAPLTAALRKEAATARHTLFPLLLGFTSAFLYRHTGQSDLVTGVPASGREDERFATSVGFFVNTLPVRHTVAPAASLRALMSATADNLAEALAHQALPLEKVLAALPVPRQAARNPLFDVLVAYEEQAWSAPHSLSANVSAAPALSPLAMQPYPLPHTRSKLDLSFYFRERADGGIDLDMEYAAELFEPETVERMAARFVHLLEHAVAHPDAPLCSLPLLPPAESALLDSFNRTDTDWNLNSSIDSHFRRQALLTPDAVALREADTTLTYAGLERRAAALTARLRDAGVRPGDFVGVSCPRSIDMMTAIFAVMRAGGVYVPFTPGLPPTRVAAMLEDLTAADRTHEDIARGRRNPKQRVVLVPPAGSAAFAEHGVLCIDPASADPADAPNGEPAPDNPLAGAYVIFTSGSTGRPKGVLIRHESVLNRLFWMQSQFPLDHRDVILQKTPVSFDVSIWELLWWSWTGASLALLEPGGEMDPAAIVDAVQRHGVTVMHFVPSMLRAFVEHLESRPQALPRLHTLRYVFASGEALTTDLVARCNALLYAHNGTELHNLYGPTEATVDVTWQPCSGPVTEELQHTVPIGRPIANTRLLIVDAHNQPVPVGVPGELCLRGVQVGEGYVSRPDLTLAAFVPDPDTPAARMYRTGDLCRWRSSGVVEYLGRKDDQVKIRGFRIELGEVEAALARCPGVRGAAVRVGLVGGMPALEAFVCLPDEGANEAGSGTASPALAVIRAFLTSNLPEYMHPSLYFRTSALPLSPNGKIDRKALRGEPLGVRSKTGSAGESVATAARSTDPLTLANGYAYIEAILRDVWTEILPESANGSVDDGFFEAGGSSLLLIRLHDALDKRWPGLLSVGDLFTYASIRRQAEHIDAKTRATNTTSTQTNKPRAHGHPKSRAIAVIGMALRLADYEDAACFWADLTEGRDRTKHLPAQRVQDVRELLAVLGIQGHQGDLTEHLRPLACLHDIAGFDCRRFGMSPADARLLDPEQRLFLETSLRALEDAGYAGSTLTGTDTGVFVGASPTNFYADALRRAFPHLAERAYVLNVPSTTATRIGFIKDWSGPAAVVDTACSSALKAMVDACTALHRGDCSVALAGAAKIHLLPVGGESHFTIETKTGQTRAFDAQANGVGSGEGAVVFVLKPLELALQHGDAIHAVIKGGAVTQNGHSSSLAAPRPDAQANAIRAAAAHAGVNPADLHFFEAHGTATALGDPAEIAGLTMAFDDTAASKTKRPIGSVKGNFGHLDSAAGAISAAKAILALKHGVVPRQPWYESPNPAIAFAASPVQVAAENQPLPAHQRPWRCGVSSFGLSGINVHVVLQEAPATPRNTAKKQHRTHTKTVAWLPLSAGDDHSLRLHCARMADALEKMLENKGPEPDLTAVAATLTLGRDHLPVRMAVLACSLPGAVAALRTWLAASTAAPVLSPELTHLADATDSEKETFTATLAAATAFLNGNTPVWPEQLPVRRVHLPTVPLCRQRCWPEWPAPALPLLGKGVSGPTGWCFPVPVTNPAFWPVAEHRVAGHPTLVGMGSVALLGEAWRAAVCGTADQSTPLEIHNLVWQKPLTVRSPDCVATLLLHTATLAGRTHFDATLSARHSTSEDFVPCVHARLAPLPTESQPTPRSLADLRDATEPDKAPRAEQTTGLVHVSARWQCVRERRRSADGSNTLLFLELPEAFRADVPQGWHPALLDVAASAVLEESGFVPAACERVRLYHPLPHRVYAWCRRRKTGNAHSLTADCTLLDETGVVLAELHGLTFLALKTGGASNALPHTIPRLHEPVWQTSRRQKQPPASYQHPTSTEKICILGSAPLAKVFARLCAQAGIPCTQAPFPHDDASRDELAKNLTGDLSNNLHVLCFPQATECGWPFAACLQAVLQTRVQQPLRWTVVTQGAFGPFTPLQDEQSLQLPVSATYSPDWALALGGTLCLPFEEPLLRLRLIDVEADTPDDLLRSACLSAFEPGADFPAIATQITRLTHDGEQLERILSAPLPETVPEKTSAKSDSPAQGCVVITGGLGGMGLTLAETAVPLLGTGLALITSPGKKNELWETPQSWPALCNSSNPVTAQRAAALLRLQNELHIPLRVYVCDVTQRDDLSRTLARIRSDFADMGGIGGILHAAGVAGDGFLLHKTRQAYTSVLAPKVEGARHLHDLTRNDALRFFVLASSRTGLTGAPGQVDYAAANAWLDALAHQRRSMGLPALSINWNMLAQAGMAANLLRTDRRTAELQATALLPEQLMDVLLRALHSSAAQVVVTAPNENIPSKTLPEHATPVVPHAEKMSAQSAPLARLDRAGLSTLVLDILREELGYDDPLTEDDDYYTLGGESLTAATIVSRITKTGAVTASLTDLLGNSRLRDFVDVLMARLTASESGNTATHTHEPKKATPQNPAQELWPVSREQLSVVLAEMSAEAGTSFNLHNFVTLPATVSARKLELALNALMERHEILCTRFVLHHAGTPDMTVAMRIVEQQPYSLIEQTVPALDAAVTAACIRPFTLFGEEPLFRAMLLHTAQESVLFFDIHHALADARTVSLLLHELYLLCHDQPLPPFDGPHMKDAALRQHLLSQTAEGKAALDADREFWLAQYPGALPKLHLPMDRARPQQHTRQGASTGFALSPELTGQLHALSRKQGVTLYTVLLTLWQLLLTRYAATSEIVIATAAETRQDDDLANTPGMFVSLLPMRLRLLPGDGLDKLLRRNQRLHVAALEHRNYALHQLLKDLRPVAAPERTLLAEISFSYMNFGPLHEGFAPLPVPNPASKADIAFFISDMGDSLYIALEYYAAIFDLDRMERMIQDFLTLTEQTVHMCLQRDDGAVAVTQLVAGIAVPPGFVADPSAASLPGANLPGAEQAVVPVPTFPAPDLRAAAWEGHILHVFQTIFGPDVEPDDSFFSLGGHSLLGVQTINALANKTGLNLRISALYDHPSPAALARHVAAMETAQEKNLPESLHQDISLQQTTPQHARAVDAEDADAALFPAPHAQQRLYMAHYTDQADPAGGNAYAMPFLFRLVTAHGATIPAAETLRGALLTAMQRLCQRHPVLRATFMEQDGVIMQCVNPTAAINAALDHAFTIHPCGTEQEALRQAGAFMLRPFALSAAPLLRVGLFPHQDGVLAALSMHHIIGDGWSMPILLSEWMALFADPDAVLAPVQIPAFPATAGADESLTDWTAERDYWKAALHNAPLRLELPVDAPVAAWTDPPRMGLAATQLAPATTEKLRGAARRSGVSLATLLLGLYGILLFKLTRQDDMVINVGVAGRERPELENAVGFFVNILPIRLCIDDRTDLETLLHSTHQTFAEALSRQSFPYDLLIHDLLGHERAPSRGKGLMNVAFEYQRYSDLRPAEHWNRQSQATRELFEPVPEELWMDECEHPRTAKYDLSLFAQDIPAMPQRLPDTHTANDADDQAGVLRLKLEYSRNVLKPETAHVWLSHFIRFVESVADGVTKDQKTGQAGDTQA